MTLHKFIFTLFLFYTISLLNAQNISPVKWTTSIKNSKTENIEIEICAKIKDGYFIYDSISKTPEVKNIQFYSPLIFLITETKFHKKFIVDKIFSRGKIEVLDKNNYWTISIPNKEKKISHTFLEVSYTVFNDKEFLQLKDTLELKIKESQTNNNLIIPNFDVKKPLFNSIKNNSSSNILNEKSSAWEIFILGVIGGLISLLTPCVFPMIPLTISFFGKSSHNKKESFLNALFYGLSIIGIYFLLSLPFHLVDNFSPQFLNNLSTNVYLNGLFFIVMVIFGISFLGVFEIQLPSQLINFSDSKSNAKHLLGIFFMALTLCIVSFSCTGPILGTLLVNTLSNSNGAFSLSIGLLGFGLGMGLPFSILSLFPKLLKSLPRSGAWMSEFKIFLAFVEFALALKFFSNIDLVLHWGILKKEIMLILWALLMFLYLLHLLKVFQRFKKQKISLTKYRKILAGIIFLFTIYLIIGATKLGHNNPSIYNWLSNGILPSNFYSIYTEKEECILDIPCAKNYEEALLLSKKLDRPLLIDFTGWACVNCRKMEENVWANASIQKILRENFVLVSLYVDDRKKIAEPFYITINNEKKLIETIGDQWSYFQILNFKNNAQPLYAILNNNQQLLIPTIGYTPNVQEYKKWLEEGIEAYKK